MNHAANSSITTRAYEIVPGSAGHIGLRLEAVSLVHARVEGEQLVGRDVTVINRAVLLGSEDGAELSGFPVPPLQVVDGSITPDPARGGVRAKVNRRESGARNAEITQATHFGMVNAFHHVAAAATRTNRLLAELGVAPLPRVIVVVGAHFGSRSPGFAQGDGDERSGRFRPFSGGHYRVSTIASGILEPVPIAPTGEIHLGPGRARRPYGGDPSYLIGAAHNPATMYHEFGHHLCRHTADFRLNAERRATGQRNGKLGVEEGIADYLAASLLGTGRPYGWYRPERGRHRDPAAMRSDEATDALATDPHEAGRPWAAALWRTRERLLAEGLLPDAAAHDRALIDALLEIGRVAARSGDPRPRSQRQTERGAPETVVRAYVAAVARAAGPRAGRIAETAMRHSGVLDIATTVVDE